MLSVDDIDYMIATLHVVRKELEYKENYTKQEKQLTDHEKSWLFHVQNRMPKNSLIRDSLKNVSRLSRVAINDMKREG